MLGLRAERFDFAQPPRVAAIRYRRALFIRALLKLTPRKVRVALLFRYCEHANIPKQSLAFIDDATSPSIDRCRFFHFEVSKEEQFIEIQGWLI